MSFLLAPDGGPISLGPNEALTPKQILTDRDVHHDADDPRDLVVRTSFDRADRASTADPAVRPDDSMVAVESGSILSRIRNLPGETRLEVTTDSIVQVRRHAGSGHHTHGRTRTSTELIQIMADALQLQRIGQAEMQRDPVS